MDMMIPTIHMNGNSRETLTDQCGKALYAVRDAIDACREMAPNGRNYYTQGPGAIGKAISEHEDRMTKLFDVRDELERMMESIVDA
jgi:hypothetical protein